jgi:hypothetical protein
MGLDRSDSIFSQSQGVAPEATGVVRPEVEGNMDALPNCARHAVRLHCRITSAVLCWLRGLLCLAVAPCPAVVGLVSAKISLEFP